MPQLAQEPIGQSVVDLAIEGNLRAERVIGGEQHRRASFPANVVKSAGRTLQILEFFDDVRRDANLIEIARALAYPRSSTSILLRSLVTMGYLEYDGNARTYRPTSRVRLLGSWIDPSLFQGGTLLDLMSEINAETGHTVILATRNALSSQYIHVVQANTEEQFRPERGAMRSLAASVTGWVLLSKLPDFEVAKLVRRTNAEAGPDEPLVKVPELLHQLKEIRRAGYAFSRCQSMPGSVILAMPLPDGLAQTPIVIAIAGPAEHLAARRESLVALLGRKVSRLKPV